MALTKLSFHVRKGVGPGGGSRAPVPSSESESHFLKVSQLQVRQTLELSWVRKDRRAKAVVNLLTQLQAKG